MNMRIRVRVQLIVFLDEYIHSSDRIPGCQSLNHTKCYGELWQCENCGKTICWAEGTDNHSELCDDCWVERFGNADDDTIMKGDLYENFTYAQATD